MTSSLPEIVITSSPDGPIIAYDPHSGAVLAHFTGSRSPPRGLTLVGKGFIAASHISATGSGSINLYNWWSSTIFDQIPLPEPVAPLAATLDGAFLFAGGLSGHIYAMALPSGKILQSFPAHTKSVSCVAINEDGSLLVSGSDDGTIIVAPIFQLVAATPLKNPGDLVSHCFNGHASSVTTISAGIWSIISCSMDGTCKFWCLLQGALLQTVAFPCPVSATVMDPTESCFYAAGSDGKIYIGPTKGKSSQLVTWHGRHGGPVAAVRMMNQGRNLVTAAEDGSVWVWEVERGEVMTVLGNEMVSVSEMVIAKGVANGGGAVKLGIDSVEWSRDSTLGGGREMSRPLRKIEEMKDMLSVAAKDRSKAIDILESAIGAYERLLELILKEAKGGSGTKNVGKERDCM